MLVGASCASLYADGPIPIRPTQDIDLVVRADGYVAWQSELEPFRAARFEEAATGPMCRFTGHGLTIDVMPLPWAALGTNRWYADGWNTRVRHSETGIHHLTPLYFLATKLDAFSGRGRAELPLSDDLEDIVVILRNRVIPWSEIEQGVEPVHRYIRAELAALATADATRDAMTGYFEGNDAAQQEAEALVSRLRGLGSP
jgi:hypothetical protein